MFVFQLYLVIQNLFILKLKKKGVSATEIKELLKMHQELFYKMIQKIKFIQCQQML